jgi:hypothetical protein
VGCVGVSKWLGEQRQSKVDEAMSEAPRCKECAMSHWLMTHRSPPLLFYAAGAGNRPRLPCSRAPAACACPQEVPLCRVRCLCRCRTRWHFLGHHSLTSEPNPFPTPSSLLEYLDETNHCGHATWAECLLHLKMMEGIYSL